MHFKKDWYFIMSQVRVLDFAWLYFSNNFKNLAPLTFLLTYRYSVLEFIVPVLRLYATFYRGFKIPGWTFSNKERYLEQIVFSNWWFPSYMVWILTHTVHVDGETYIIYGSVYSRKLNFFFWTLLPLNAPRHPVGGYSSEPAFAIYLFYSLILVFVLLFNQNVKINFHSDIICSIDGWWRNFSFFIRELNILINLRSWPWILRPLRKMSLGIWIFFCWLFLNFQEI